MKKASKISSQSYLCIDPFEAKFPFDKMKKNHIVNRKLDHMEYASV